jgi:hypothetical protein
MRDSSATCQREATRDQWCRLPDDGIQFRRGPTTPRPLEGKRSCCTDDLHTSSSCPSHPTLVLFSWRSVSCCRIVARARELGPAARGATPARPLASAHWSSSVPSSTPLTGRLQQRPLAPLLDSMAAAAASSSSAAASSSTPKVRPTLFGPSLDHAVAGLLAGSVTTGAFRRATLQHDCELAGPSAAGL